MQRDTLKYHYMQSEMFSHFLQKGETKLMLSNVFQDRIPSQLVIAFVLNSSYSGAFDKNPFNFQNFDINFLNLIVNGKSMPYQEPFRLDYSSDEESTGWLSRKGAFVRAFLSTVASTGRYLKDEGIDINLKEFKTGYNIYCFNLDPAFDRSTQQPLSQGGNLKVEVNFSVPLPDNVSVIFYGNFPKTLEVDQARNVYLMGN